MPNPDESLRWLAFQYVMDDLDAVEQTRFEEELEQSQDAREAVAEAVALSAGIVAAEEWQLAPATPRKSRMHPYLQIACGVLTIAAAWLLWLHHTPIPDVPIQSAMTASADTAIALTPEFATSWLEIAERFEAIADDPNADEEWLSSADDELTAPSWMIAALGSLPEADGELEN